MEHVFLWETETKGRRICWIRPGLEECPAPCDWGSDGTLIRIKHQHGPRMLRKTDQWLTSMRSNEIKTFACICHLATFATHKISFLAFRSFTWHSVWCWEILDFRYVVTVETFGIGLTGLWEKTKLPATSLHPGYSAPAQPPPDTCCGHFAVFAQYIYICIVPAEILNSFWFTVIKNSIAFSLVEFYCVGTWDINGNKAICLQKATVQSSWTTELQQNTGAASLIFFINFALQYCTQHFFFPLHQV